MASHNNNDIEMNTEQSELDNMDAENFRVSEPKPKSSNEMEEYVKASKNNNNGYNSAPLPSQLGMEQQKNGRSHGFWDPPVTSQPTSSGYDTRRSDHHLPNMNRKNDRKYNNNSWYHPNYQGNDNGRNYRNNNNGYSHAQNVNQSHRNEKCSYPQHSQVSTGPLNNGCLNLRHSLNKRGVTNEMLPGVRVKGSTN
ncbi:GATA zinc finger domain-containing protein 14-like [Schistocerca piceifrons]|uniref:GATA zinc finger domain-containing protein 14-like n=1 Tax=Schistocerca piceifrons TaxID=274613 RepID=UPI001F5FAEB0|nr:GATA zinc finger domain-containing protein 14-like [Schistocerca piceifrons]